jgi:SAM-dependent methyltransferase
LTDAVRERKRAAYALLELKPGESVLDVGCGPGTDVFELESMVGPTGRVVGVDASSTMIDEARRRATERGSRVELRVADAESLDLADSTFDAVRTERVLMHLGDPGRAIGEFVRVLKPGGRVVCVEPDHQMSAIDATDGALSDAVSRGLNATTRSPRIGRQLRRLFLAAGLVNVEVQVAPLVLTSLDSYLQLQVSPPEQAAQKAEELGIASAERVRALYADYEALNAAGQFFSCAIVMRCRGHRPT